MLSIIFIAISVLLIIYNYTLFHELIDDSIKDIDENEGYKNKFTIAVPITDVNHFYRIFNIYRSSHYLKKEGVYCFEDISDEEFARLVKNLDLFSVPYMNGILNVDVKHRLYFSRTFQNTYFLRYNKGELNSVYNMVINIADADNIILTKYNAYIDDRSFFNINRNINKGYDFQTGVSISDQNLTDFEKTNEHLLFPLINASTYKLIRQLEKFIYDKSAYTSVGGYDNEFLVIRKYIIIDNLGFNNKVNLVEDLFSRISIKREYQGILDPNISVLYFEEKNHKLLPQIFIDKVNSINLTRNTLLKVNSLKQFETNMVFIFKKAMRFFNIYLNMFLWLGTGYTIIYALNNDGFFNFSTLMLFILVTTNIVLATFLFFEQQERMHFQVDKNSLAKIFVNMFIYLILIRILGFFIICYIMFINLLKKIFKRKRSSK